MIIDARLKLVLRVLTGVGLIIVYVPLALVMINSFNVDRTFTWPPSGFTLHWWNAAAHTSGARAALLVSIQVGLLATAVALILGTLASLALRRTRFFGRNAVSLVIILPIALPGIVTGIALNNAFRTILGINLGLFTAIVAHATFCIVVVFNNVVARLRRLGNNLEEASMDLGADGITTFRLVTFPMLRSALLAGGLLAFALSRFRFFGKNAISLLFLLPIALPGIVTGMALLSAIEYLNITPSLWTAVAGHATFCIVVVYNNAVARLRRTSVSFEEASMDLGADGWQTFRHVTLPNLSTALVAGGLLAFALSFDEVVVTLFTAGSQQTLPLWMYEQFKLPNTAPEANAVAVFVIALTALPIYFAQRLMRDTGGITGR